MANEIDNRIVQMQFDNAQFERGVSTSISTLDKLKSALKLDGVAKGFEQIQNIGNSLHFNILNASLTEAVKNFNVLDTVAIAAIARITTKAVDAGLSLAKSLSVDQIIAGWSKFETKAQSTATIMGATGKSVEEVGDQLAILNTYTDETSASFTDMTNNIGKFTNAGIDLEDAVYMMQGITNWGYKAGATINEAGRAMYNLSQAMAVGSVKLVDWKSIENANMATKEFKQAAIDVAVAQGTLKDAGDGLYKTLEGTELSVTNFSSSLKDAWFTADVLGETLERYGGFSNDLIAAADRFGVSAFDLMQSYNDWESSASDIASIAADLGIQNVDDLRKAFDTMGIAVTSVAKRMVKAKAENEELELSEDQLAEKASEMSERLRDAYWTWLGDQSIVNDLIEETGWAAEDLQTLFESLATNQTLGKEAYRAAGEYRSLRDAIDATKDAVSTGWMNIFEAVFGNYEEAKAVWTGFGETLLELFGTPISNLQLMLQEWHKLDFGGYESFANALTNILDTILAIKDATDEAFGHLFEKFDVNYLQKLTSNFEEFTRQLKVIFTGEGIEYTNPLEKFTSGIRSADEALSETPIIQKLNKLNELQKVIADVANDTSKSLEEEGGSLFEFYKSADQDYSSIIADINKEKEKLSKYSITSYRKISDLANEIQNEMIASGLAEVTDFEATSDRIFGKYSDIVWSYFGLSKEAIEDTANSAIYAASAYERVSRPMALVDKIAKDLSEVQPFEVIDLEKAEQSLADISNVAKYNDFIDFLGDVSNIIEAIKSGAIYINDAFTPLFTTFTTAGKSVLETVRGIVDTLSRWSTAKDVLEVGKNSFIAPEAREEAEKVVSVIDKLETIVQGVVSAFNILKDIAGQVWETLKMFWDPIVTIGGDVLDLITAIAKRFTSLDEANNEQSGILGFFNKLREKLGPVIEWVTDVIHGILTALTNIIDPDTNGDLSEFGETFNHIFTGIGNVLRKIFPILSKIGQFIGTIIGGITEKIGGFMQNATLMDFLNLINGGLAAGIGAGLLNITNNLSKTSDKVPGILDPIKTLFGWLTGKGKETSEAASSGTRKGFWQSLSEGLTGFLDDISASLKKAIDVQAIKTFATAILMLAGALFLLSLIDMNTLAQAWLVLTVSVGEIIAAMDLFASHTGKDIAKILAGAAAITIMAGGILVLSIALAILSFIPMDKMGMAIILLAAGIAVMAIALGQLAEVGPEILYGAAALLIMAPALLAMAAAFAILAFIPFDKMGMTMIAFASGIATMSIALTSLAKEGPMILAAAAALLILAPAVDLMALALIALSFVPLTHMLTAILGFAAGLTVMSLALAFVAAVGPQALVAAAALLVLAPALVLMSAALLMLSFASSGKLLANLVMLAAAIAAFIAASLFLAPIVGPMFAVAGAMLVFGAAIGVVGTGLIYLSAGLTAVVAAIVGMILTVTSGLVTFVKLIGELAEALGVNLIGGIIKGIAGAVKILIEGIGDVALGIINTFKKVLGIHSPSTVFEGFGGNIIDGLCGGLSDGMPEVASISKLLGNTVTSSAEEGINEGKGGLLDSVTGLFGDVGSAATEMLPDDSLFSIFSGSGVNVSEIEKVSDAYDELHESVSAISDDAGLESILGSLGDFSATVDFSSISYGAESFDDLNESITKLDSEGVSNLTESLDNLVVVVSDNLDTVSTRVNEMVPLMLNCGEAFVNALVNGIRSKASTLVTAASYVIEGLINAIRELLPKVLEIGEEIGDKLIEGARKSLDENSPSKEFADIGEFSVIGLLDSIRNRLDDVKDAGKSIGEALLDSTEEALSDYGDVLSPVVDMSLNASGYSGINALAMAHSASNSMPIRTEANNQNVKNNSPVFNIYQQPGQDSEDLARIINRELGRLLVT